MRLNTKALLAALALALPSFAHASIIYDVDGSGTGNVPAGEAFSVVGTISFDDAIAIDGTGLHDLTGTFANIAALGAFIDALSLTVSCTNDCFPQFTLNALSDINIGAADALGYVEDGTDVTAVIMRVGSGSQFVQFGVGQDPNALEVTATDNGACSDPCNGSYTLALAPTNGTAPEPGTLALLGLGVLGMGFARRRSRSR